MEDLPDKSSLDTALSNSSNIIDNGENSNPRTPDSNFEFKIELSNPEGSLSIRDDIIMARDSDDDLDSRDAGLAIEENLLRDINMDDDDNDNENDYNEQEVEHKPLNTVTFVEDAKNDSALGLDIIIPAPLSTKSAEQKEKNQEKNCKSRKEMEEEDREKIQALVSNFTEEQLDRYEMYRRSAFPKAIVKRLMETITGCAVSENAVIAMSGIAKVFAGEVVETALEIMEEHGETGALLPRFLQEALLRLRNRGAVPNGQEQKTFLG